MSYRRVQELPDASKVCYPYLVKLLFPFSCSGHLFLYFGAKVGFVAITKYKLFSSRLLYCIHYDIIPLRFAAQIDNRFKLVDRGTGRGVGKAKA